MSKFTYPSAAEFAAMSVAEFEKYWTMFEALMKPFPFHVGKHDIRDVIRLKRLGWVPDFNGKETAPWAWNWRRPKRPGTRDRKGKLVGSTGQAISLLRTTEAEQTKNDPVRPWNIMVNAGGEMHPGIVPARNYLEAQRMADMLCGYVTDPDPSNATAV